MAVLRVVPAGGLFAGAAPVGAMALGGLPTWLVLGVGLGLVAAAGVWAAFAVGTRRFGDATPPEGSTDPHGRRRAEVRAYLVGLGEPFRERETVAGFDVDFWLPRRAVAVTFDAEAYLGLVGAGHTAVLLEHELPGGRIGPRLPFETATPSLGTAATRVDRGAYARLGLEAGADRADVEAAYRERVLEAHPDQGGDPEELREVLRAYDRLVGSARA